MRFINILPPMNTKSKIWVTSKLPISSVEELHTFLENNFQEKAKDESNMFSLIELNGMRYLKEFVTYVFGVTIDIDDGDYDEVKGKLDKNGVNYFMYTTHSNGKNGEERFRVVILLDKKYSVEDFVYATRHLKKMFESFNIDSSTFNVARRFVLPPIDCQYDYSNGKLLNIEKAVEIGKKREISVRRFEKIADKPKFNKSIKGLQSYINKIEWNNGSKHNNLVFLIHKFKSDGYTFNEIKQVVDENTSFRINWSLLNNLR